MTAPPPKPKQSSPRLQAVPTEKHSLRDGTGFKVLLATYT